MDFSAAEGLGSDFCCSYSLRRVGWRGRTERQGHRAELNRTIATMGKETERRDGGSEGVCVCVLAGRWGAGERSLARHPRLHGGVENKQITERRRTRQRALSSQPASGGFPKLLAAHWEDLAFSSTATPAKLWAWKSRQRQSTTGLKQEKKKTCTTQVTL